MLRSLSGITAKAIEFISAGYAILFLVQAYSGFLLEINLRIIYVAVGLILVLALHRTYKKEPATGGIPYWDWILIAVAIAGSINIFLKVDVVYVTPWLYTIVDIVFGALMLFLLLESSRRGVGSVLTYIAVVCILLGILTPHLPSIWKVAAISPDFLISQLYFNVEGGIYGGLVGLGARIIAIFLLFSAFILGTGCEKAFVNIPLRIAGKSQGGPAKVAVVASALMGTITGATVPNVMVTGSFTIPLMKRIGYKPEFAAAVEATASTGGAITPPIMAVGALIMAEFLGVSYLKIIFHAIIPAFLFYFALYVHITLEAKRTNLPGVPKEEIPTWREIITWQSLAPFTLSILTLLSLLAVGFSLQFSGFWTCMVIIGIFLFSPPFSFSQMKSRVHAIWRALIKGGQVVAEIGILIVLVNVIVSALGTMGLLIKLSEFIIVVGEGNIILALLLSALLPLLFGMAVPPMAGYVLAVAIIAPILAQLGFDLLRIHFFTFMYSCFGPVSPPVCLAVYAAASIAKCSWLKASVVAMGMLFVAFLIPLVFMLDASFLGIGPPIQILLAVFLALIGILFIASSYRGYLQTNIGILKRIIYGASGLTLIFPVANYIRWIGLAAGAMIFAHTLFIKRR